MAWWNPEAGLRQIFPLMDSSIAWYREEVVYLTLEANSGDHSRPLDVASGSFPEKNPLIYSVVCAISKSFFVNGFHRDLIGKYFARSFNLIISIRSEGFCGDLE